MPKRKQKTAEDFTRRVVCVATLPCQSGNTVDCRVFRITLRVATLPCQSGNYVCLWIAHNESTGCNFTMPKRKRGRLRSYREGQKRLQLYHAKAETTLTHCNLKRSLRVATLPCQSGNMLPKKQPSSPMPGCNFTMPKRKLGSTRLPSERAGMLQLYHAKAETDKASPKCECNAGVATLPCQSGNSVMKVATRNWFMSCNFTMPKRKR